MENYTAIKEAIENGRIQGMTLDAIARAILEVLKPEEVVILLERLDILS